MKHTFSVGGIIIGPQNLVAVVSQHGTSWSLPKGTMEAGEDKMTTLSREIKEETGITDYKIIKELGSYDRYLIGKKGGEDITHRKTITIYLMTTAEENLTPEDPENPEARWVEPDKVAELLTHPKDQEFYLKNLPQVQAFIASQN